ncbi:UPF0481 protein At3g47200-like [Argentina anserina]|uniref:UPF0481 protein At3g47200-like n=1 Tax=Argentina anserina TaxID=57926 RepID=UPI002176937F|nr:UPF0481 protein At3g47200-like [Potentilla anserina]
MKHDCTNATMIEEQFSDDFATMIVKDARFIIEVMLRYHFPKLRLDNDIMLTEPRLSQLRRDMGLLENQLPFFILEKLFDPESITGLSPSDRAGLSVIKLSYNFFKPLMHVDKGTEGDLEDIICSSRPHHFVDLLRSFYVRNHYMKAEAKGKLRTVPSVKELQQGDVKFEVLNSSNNLFDIKFLADTKILKIPKVIISHETELTIRNVLAFEQCHRTLAENYMTDYVMFMDRLMSTEEDVRLLAEKKIVKILIPKDRSGTISSKTSAKELIKNLTEGVIVDPNSFYFAELCQNVDKYCRSPKVVQKTIAVICLLLSVTANILQAIICQKNSC